MSGRLGDLVELLDGAPPHLTSCLVELISNCAELPAAREVQHCSLECLPTALQAASCAANPGPITKQISLIHNVAAKA